MTRESKLALIVGFGLILFVGILVSDHFSAGQRQAPANLIATRGALRHGPSVISIQPMDGSKPSDTRTVRNEPPSQAHIGNGVEVQNPQPTSPEMTGPRNPTSETGSGTADAPILPPSPINPTPAERLYPVKEGETLYSICASEYGDGSLWEALAAFNKAAVPNPARMRKGVTLRLPPIEVLKPGRAARGLVVPTTPQITPVQKARDDSTGSRIPKADTIAHSAELASYTVQRGETLVSIAKKKLGSSARWPELAKLNEDSVPDPHALVPGTVIRIPRSS